MPVFTQRSSDIMEAIITECKICPPVDFANGEMPSKVYTSQNAMWDTGATNTLISPKIVKALGLKPFGKSGISSANGIVETNTYLVHVGIPSGSVVTNILALEDENDDYEVVIGMDIISRGDFAFSNYEGHSTFSFRIPSQEEIILK